jgi:hypothetical protein
MAKNRRRSIDGFLESYRRGSDRLRENIRPLREAPGEFMPLGPGKHAGDASGKLAYEPGTPGGESKGTRTGGGRASGYNKGNVKQGAPWDTTAYDHARKASMYHCGECGANNAVLGEASAFRCHSCESVTKISKIGDSFRRVYGEGRSEMQRMTAEAAAVKAGMDHDESEDEDEDESEHDSRRGAFPGASAGIMGDDDDDDGLTHSGGVGDTDPLDDEEEAYGDGASSISAGSDMANSGQGAPGGATSEDEDEDEDEDEAAPRMRAAFKCAKCGERVMHHMRLARASEDEVVNPVMAKCAKGHQNAVAPPGGYKFSANATAAESVRGFFRRYYRESGRGAAWMP